MRFLKTMIDLKVGKEGDQYLKSQDSIMSIEYMELFDCSQRTARMDLKGLVDWGIVDKKGKGNKIHYILNKAYRQLPAIAGNGDGN